jgi:hypothetical protein
LDELGGARGAAKRREGHAPRSAPRSTWVVGRDDAETLVVSVVRPKIDVCGE